MLDRIHLSIGFLQKLYPFPTKKKRPEDRLKWRQLINREAVAKRGICSEHFADGRPTAENPFPTKKSWV